MTNGRIKDLATLLPWAGLFLLTPPVLFLFRPSTTILGIPLLPVYLFIIWLALIIASRKLTDHLIDEPASLSSSQQNKPDHSAANSPDGA